MQFLKLLIGAYLLLAGIGCSGGNEKVELAPLPEGSAPTGEAKPIVPQGAEPQKGSVAPGDRLGR